MRFFSFESILLLTLMNYRIWFTHPFSSWQILSWIMLLTSLYAAVTGFTLLAKKGKPRGKFENTSELIATGIYKYIRHPMYLSLLLLGTGILMKDPGWLQITLGAVNALALYFTAKIEEWEMIARFGDSYRDYRKKTKMFIPYIF